MIPAVDAIGLQDAGNIYTATRHVYTETTRETNDEQTPITTSRNHDRVTRDNDTTTSKTNPSYKATILGD